MINTFLPLTRSHPRYAPESPVGPQQNTKYNTEKPEKEPRNRK